MGIGWRGRAGALVRHAGGCIRVAKYVGDGLGEGRLGFGGVTALNPIGRLAGVEVKESWATMTSKLVPSD